jgi:hypothetical protein
VQSKGIIGPVTQVTFHPVIVHKLVFLCIVHDCMAHVASTFYAIQKVMIQYLETLYSSMEEAILQCWNCVTVYEQKHFFNLINRLNSLSVAAEWHFFATSVYIHSPICLHGVVLN